MINLAQQGYSHDEVIKLLERIRGIDNTYFQIEVIRNAVHICWLDYTECTVECDSEASVKYSASLFVADDPKVNWRTDFIRLVMFLPVGETVLRFNFVPLKPITITEEWGYGFNGLNIKAYDETIILKDNSLSQSMRFEKGTPYLSIIKRIMSDVGYLNISITPTDKVLATDRLFEMGGERLNIINTLLDEINYHSLEVNVSGAFVSSKYEPPTIQTARIHYRSGRHDLIEPEKQITRDSYKKYNRFVGYCANPDMGEDLVYEFTNASPGDPTSTVNQGYTITAPPIQHDNVADLESLGGLVLKLAMETSQSYRNATFHSAIMPHHGVGEVLTVKSDGVDGLWCETVWLIDVTRGRMEHQIRSVSYV